MKKYKAIIIDGKKLFRRFTAGLLLLSLLFIGARLCAFSLQRANFSLTPNAETMLGDVIPSVTVTANGAPSVKAVRCSAAAGFSPCSFNGISKTPPPC